MAMTYPLDRDYTISTADHGNTLVLGNSSLGDRAGAWEIQFVPSVGWAGSFTVVARTTGLVPSTDGVGFVPVPYRTINLGGIASDYSIASAVLTDGFIIQVPANGLAVALTVASTAGTGRLYSQMVTSGAAP